MWYKARKPVILGKSFITKGGLTHDIYQSTEKLKVKTHIHTVSDIIKSPKV